MDNNTVNNVRRISIANPQILHIKKENGISYGASQEWYRSFIARMSGCGPTTTSNLIWYLAMSRPDECSGLADWDCSNQKGMLRLMKAVWKYVKPGLRGVDKASMLVEGAYKYAREKGVELTFKVLEIPEHVSERPTDEEVVTFLKAAFNDDYPVAFLNLSNGTVENLDNWHWVTLVSTDDELNAEMYDDSCSELINLKQWMESTTKGGAFVVIGI